MRIVLAGAGIGGLTAALAAPESAEILVVEKAARLEEAGAGIQLSANACRVLFGLGLGEPVRAIAFEPEAVDMRQAPSGWRLLYIPLGRSAEQRWGYPYLHIHRADLQTVLLDAVRRRPNVELRLGVGVRDVRPTADGAEIETTEGTRLAADAVVGCDGLRSRVRAALWGEEKPNFTGQTAWRGTVDARRLPPGLVLPVAGFWNGPGRHFVHYYLRRGELVNFVGVVEHKAEIEHSWAMEGDPEEVKQDYAGWPAPVQAILAATERTFLWPLYDRPPLPQWSKGAVTLLGDAAHPMLPFMAQGAAMAIEDAAVMGRLLRRSPDVASAFQAYEAERLPRVVKVYEAARRNATLFHLPALASTLTFAAARFADSRKPDGAQARFDWLYGYRADE